MKVVINGKESSIQEGSRLVDVLKGIDEAIAAAINGNLADLQTELKEGDEIITYTFDSIEGKSVYWHTSSHIMAQAIKRLYPQARLTIGPAVENGFYYDIDLDKRITPQDFKAIEKEIKKIIGANYPIVREEISKEEAINNYFKDNKYKIEIINEIEDDIVSIYKQGEFYDLCRGPHLESTGKVGAIKIMSVAGAYWRGDANNAALQRVYGISFPTKEQLNTYIKNLEEAKKYDHRRLGRELDLFSFHDEGPGFPFWHPKGTIIYNELVNFVRQENKRRGYNEIKTPVILNDSLWKRSGHWDNFKDNMYFTEIDGISYAIKPMNCPGGLLVFKSRLHSYRELPIRNAEIGHVHRHELSGVLHGLFRVRAFTQDDAHVFCTKEQLKKEIKDIIEYTLYTYKIFGFEDFEIFVATRPDKYIGSDEDWEIATNTLMESLRELNIRFKIKEGEGAFYGPKIEFNIRDVFNRNWQCGTVQVDFSMPARFDITYRDSDGGEKTPIMIHRAILGSFERFIGILLEHYKGKLPLWLAPVQLKILPITDRHLDYAKTIYNEATNRDIRVVLDDRNKGLGAKIKDARLERVPWMFIIGDNEVEEGSVSIRFVDGSEKKNIPYKEALDTLVYKIKNYERF